MSLLGDKDFLKVERLSLRLELRRGLNRGVVEATLDIVLCPVECPSLKRQLLFVVEGTMLGVSLVSQVAFVSEEMVPHSLTVSSGSFISFVDVGEDGLECIRTTISSSFAVFGGVITTAPSVLKISQADLTVSADKLRSARISVTGRARVIVPPPNGDLTSTTELDSNDFLGMYPASSSIAVLFLRNSGDSFQGLSLNVLSRLQASAL